MGKGNNMIPNRHYHKWWERNVKTWFNQAARKVRKSQTRIQKAKQIFPRPLTGPLRPAVRCPTVRYQSKMRSGRGFTMTELKRAGLTCGFAKSIGIAVDRRRRNKSIESRQLNIQRLKEYKNKLVLFPLSGKKPPRVNEASPEECKMATWNARLTVKADLMPIKKMEPVIEFREVGKDEIKFKAFAVLRKTRTDARLVGIRAKKAREAAENADEVNKDARKSKK